jgi:hypothetical protein
LPSNGDDVYDKDAAEQVEVEKNISSIFGTIDPNHDWISTTRSSISITANAPLDDIAKVQVLTESPFFNESATVLNETSVKDGQTVTLQFDAPSHYTRLIAACVSSKGIYYIKGFNVGQQSVSFEEPAKARRAAPSTEDMPALSSLKLELKNATQSYNAMRTILANEAAASDNTTLKEWVKANHIDLWTGRGWENEMLWSVSNEGSTSTWRVINNSIVRDIDPIGDEEKALIEDVFKTYLNSQYVNGKRPDNLKNIRNNPLFEMEKNYLVSDGVRPITITPVQMNSSETSSNQLYYYYYNPADIAGMTKDEEVLYMKNLPKYKAIHCKYTKDAAGVSKNSDFFKVHEYLLPYYGDGTPTDGQVAQSYVLPKGYRVGFMIRKLRGSQDTKDNKIIKASDNGCAYGDGRLNVEINNFPGHYGSAKTTYSMQDEDPRAVVFGVNGRTYLTYEDGSDCNYCDMIVEVQGCERIDQAQEVESNVYTLCYEDRKMADYDMNDVVIKAKRIDQTHVSYSVEACGAWDELYIRGINGNKINASTEVHAMFGVAANQFVNTEAGAERLNPIEEIVEVPASFSFLDYDALPYIYDKTTNSEIRLSRKGEDPHAVMIPGNFMYPLEKTCIKDAYLLFKNWAQDRNNSINWYLEPQENKIYIP